MYLFGASGHGKVVCEIAEALGLKVQGFIDQNENIKSIFEYPVLNAPVSKGAGIVITIGQNTTRKLLAERLKAEKFISLVHPKSCISTRAIIDEGTVVMAGAVVNSMAKIGKHVILNTGCTVDHDCIIDDFVHISPNATLAGGVSVGEGTHIGAGATIIQGIRVGKWSVLGAGAVLINDLPDGVVAVGNPARIIKDAR